MKNKFVKEKNKINFNRILLIFFCIVIPVILCIGQGVFAVQVISEINGIVTDISEVKESGYSIAESGILTILSIAVSIWIGLNIYNALNKYDIEKRIDELQKQYELMTSSRLKYDFLNLLYKTHDKYEVSELFYYAFLYSENKSTQIYEEMILIEKFFLKCVNAYEYNNKDETEKYAEFICEHAKKYEKYENDQMIYCYMEARYSEGLFYKYLKKTNEEKYLESIELYRDLLNRKALIENENIWIAYIYNTIGITFFKLKNINSELYDFYCENAEKNFIQAIKYNPQKARYIQNLGALYQANKRFDDAKKQYDKATYVECQDFKVYMNRGAIELEIIDNKLDIKNRGDNCSENQLLGDYSKNYNADEIKTMVNEAIFWLEISVKNYPLFINGYYQLAKAYLYYYIFIEKEQKYLQDADRLLKIVEKRDAKNVGALFIRRNYFEVKGLLKEASECNEKIKNMGIKGDTENVGKIYTSKLSVN